MVFRIDSEGDIFIKAKDCETNIDQIDIAKLDFELLEAQCKPRWPSPFLAQMLPNFKESPPPLTGVLVSNNRRSRLLWIYKK